MRLLHKYARSTAQEENPIDIRRDFGILFRKPPLLNSDNRASVFRINTANKYTTNWATKTLTVSVALVSPKHYTQFSRNILLNRITIDPSN